MESNEVGDDGARNLAKAITGHKKMQNLWLEDNVVGDVGARAFARTLQRAKSAFNLTLTSEDSQRLRTNPRRLYLLSRTVAISTLPRRRLLHCPPKSPSACLSQYPQLMGVAAHGLCLARSPARRQQRRRRGRHLVGERPREERRDLRVRD